MKKILLFVLLMSIAIMSCNSKKDEAPKTDVINSDTLKTVYSAIGKSIAEDSFNALRSKMMEAMASKEIPGAVAYCNTEAYPLTDSLSQLYDVVIKRATNKFRNPKNAPDEKESSLIGYFEKLHQEGKPLGDTIIKISDNQYWYAKPIFIQGLCQNCHGNVGSTVSESNYQVIKKLYPDDKAIDYKSGDFRGIWSILMNVKK